MVVVTIERVVAGGSIDVGVVLCVATGVRVGVDVAIVVAVVTSHVSYQPIQ